ncbi:MAG: ATP-binding protein, partial [Spirochaetota bacterium]
LYQSEDLTHIDFGEYIKELTTALLQSISQTPKKVALDINIKNINLSIDTAIPLGLVLTELTTNALKYGIEANQQGKVEITIKDDGDMYVVSVSNSGKPFPEYLDFREAGTLGFQLVIALVKQLSGTIDLDTSDGTTFTITFNKSLAETFKKLVD